MLYFCSWKYMPVVTRGKNICNYLKAVRKQIAEENGIPLETEECTYHGECRGTCPRCEAEVRYLENALADRLRLGKAATVAGLALGLAACGSGGSGADTVGGAGDEMPDAEPPAAEATDTLPPPSAWRAPDSVDLIVGESLAIPIDTAALVEEEEEEDEDEVLFGIVEESDPEFPGGVEAMYTFIQENLHYPQLALENGIEGRVYVVFAVEKDGSIGDAHVLRDIGGGCGAEAVRVVNMMPRWTPGSQRGKKVRVQFNLPVNFVLPADRPRIIEGKVPAVQVETIDTTPVIDAGNSYAPTQQMEREGVKVIVQ